MSRFPFRAVAKIKCLFLSVGGNRKHDEAHTVSTFSAAAAYIIHRFYFFHNRCVGWHASNYISQAGAYFSSVFRQQKSNGSKWIWAGTVIFLHKRIKIKGNERHWNLLITTFQIEFIVIFFICFPLNKSATKRYEKKSNHKWFYFKRESIKSILQI